MYVAYTLAEICDVCVSTATEDGSSEDQCFSMTTNLILPSSFPLYQANKNDMVVISYKITSNVICGAQDKFSKGVSSLKPLSISTMTRIKLMDLRVSS